jgi:YegS/Rv2252/BmrU family lipid kinase
VLINAHSRRGKALFQPAVAALRAAGIPVAQAIALKHQQDMARLLRREIDSGTRMVIVGGGDGTLSACADLLVHTKIAMGVLPMGTGNTFARSIGIPLNLEEAATVLAAGHIEAIDVGRCNQQIFLNSVSLGLSVEIAGALDKRIKRRLSLLAWPYVGGRVLWTHRPLHLKVLDGEDVHRLRTHQLLVVNGRYVAGPITASPDASVQDNELDVFALGGAHRANLAKITFLWLRGRHMEARDAKYFTTRKLRIESLRQPYKANVDGEINEQTPLDIEVLPRALRVVVPHGFAADSV